MSAGLLESARNVAVGVLELGRTRIELAGAEMREEMARVAAAVIGGLAVLVLAALGLAFGAAALVFTVSEANRIAAAAGVAAFFLAAAGLVAWQLRRLAARRPRAFDATLTELERDLKAIRS